MTTNGNFFGTNGVCGGSPNPAIFKITPEGVLTILHRFPMPENDQYFSTMQATDGNLYGCGTSDDPNATSIAFRMTPEGAFTTLHSFPASNCGVMFVQGINQNLYGTTLDGGSHGQGTVFEISLDGTFTNLHVFTGPDGATPEDTLVEAPDATFYGTTTAGGAFGVGTVFNMTRDGELTTLHNFAPLSPDGAFPMVGLVQASDGNFYGITGRGGTNNSGTIFRLSPDGTKLTTLYSFGRRTGPVYSPMMQATDGNFYGTTVPEIGKIFKFSMGLPPFVKTLPTTGLVGTPVTVLGNNLKGASSVTFNGTPAAFTVLISQQKSAEGIVVRKRTKAQTVIVDSSTRLSWKAMRQPIRFGGAY